MQKFTITQFRATYPNEDACLDRIFQLRYSNLVCRKRIGKNIECLLQDSIKNEPPNKAINGKHAV